MLEAINKYRPSNNYDQQQKLIDIFYPKFLKKLADRQSG